MQLFGTDLLKTYWAHVAKMTSMRRDVASTSLRRHVPAGNLPPPWPPQYSKPWPPQYSKPSYAYVVDPDFERPLRRRSKKKLSFSL